ncbi:MAG: hypothetical protein J6W80_01585 [Kiritimatiellae bacterium]|nr:hypothetical protein [Kiritimatiellia bacterium]
MANLVQLKMLEELSGFLPVDKPAGIAFSSVVKTIKRKFNLVKVGHGGSLDAMASGLFIVLLGDANRYANDLMSADRTYAGAMKLGLRTNTHDIHGETIFDASATAEVPSQARIAEVLPEFKGDIFQTEPRFCSVRREGTADYTVADTGEHGQFLGHVYRFSVMPPEFSLKASKSVIVRTLVNDFGEALGTGAALSALRRTAVGKFTVGEAIPFEKLLELSPSEFAASVIPIPKAMAR